MNSAQEKCSLALPGPLPRRWVQLVYIHIGCDAQEDEYLQTATMYYDKLNSWKADNYAYDWDNKSPALHVLLTQIFPSEMMKSAHPLPCVPSPAPWGLACNPRKDNIAPTAYLAS